MRFFLFLFCLFSYSFHAISDEVNIEALSGAHYIIDKNHLKLIVNGNGSVNSPFIIDGNGITLKGDSYIRIGNNTSNIVIKNIKFENNNIFYNKSTSLIEIGKNKSSTVNNIVIDNIDFIFNKLDFIDRDKKTQFHWINIFGNNVIIRNCSFSGKRNRLPIIHVNSGFENIIIESNIFKNVPSRKGEALEAIRVGLEDGKSKTRITNNTFYRYSGDSETISIKADDVRVDNNEFINCRSGVSIRYADNCLIESNLFDNVVTSIRVAGKNHVINNNTFKIRQSDNPIVLMLGGPNYPQVNNIYITSNYFNIIPEIVLLEVQNNPNMPTNIFVNNNFHFSKNISDLNILSPYKFIHRKTTRKDGAKLYYIRF